VKDEAIPVEPPEQPKQVYATPLAVQESERPIVPTWRAQPGSSRAWPTEYGATTTWAAPPDCGAKLAL
jgi:hypothetical protein